MAPKFFITGEPRVGKTTILQKVVSALGDDCVGFCTVELRENGERIGFNIEPVNMPGVKDGPLAHVNFRTGKIVGRYQVDATDLERIVRSDKLFDKRKVLIIDEIGSMSAFSEAFKEFTTRALNDPDQKVLAIIKSAEHPWVDDIKAKFSSNVPTVEVTTENREELPAKIIRYLQVG